MEITSKTMQVGLLAVCVLKHGTLIFCQPLASFSPFHFHINYLNFICLFYIFALGMLVREYSIGEMSLH